MDILKLDGENYSIGTSLMRKAKDRFVFSNNPFGEGYQTYLIEDKKYLLTDDKLKEVYNLLDDPKESNNIYSSSEQEYFTTLKSLSRYNEKLYLNLSNRD